MTNEVVEKTRETERVFYLDYLRIVSVAAMMLLHISAQNWENMELNTPVWMLFGALNGATRWCVPVFLMISGALFLNSQRSIRIKRLLLHNVLRVFTAFIFWACIYSFIDFLNGKLAKEAVLSAFSGHYHMWFLFLIAGLYLVSPLLKCIVENEYVLKYYLVCFCVLDFAIPCLLDCLALIRIPHTADTIMAAQLAFSRLLDYLPAESVFYFVLGSCLASKEIPKPVRLALYAIGTAGYISAVLLTREQSHLSACVDLTFLKNSSVNVLAMSVAVFVFGKYGMSKLNPEKRLRDFVTHMSQCCFGMYLVHALIIEILNERFGLNTLTFQPMLSVLLIFAITFFGSFVISYALNQVPILKNYIV